MSWKEWTAFTALCGWAASGWLFPAGSGAIHGLDRLGLAFAVTAMVAILFGGLRGSGWRRRATVGARSSLFFAVPAVLIERAKTYAPETSVALIFASAPIVVVLMSGAVAQASAEMRRLVPALMGLTGVLLLLPFEMMASQSDWAANAEIVVALFFVSSAGVWLYGLSRVMKRTEALAVMGSSNALLLLGWCCITGSLDWRLRDLLGTWWVSLGNLLVPGVTVWLLQRMEPVRFSARFLVIPLMTVLEGLALLRPEVTARTVIGTLLLGVGATWLLTAKPKVDEEVLRLR